MLNVGGGEVLVILLIALIVLGPAKLPGVAKQVGGLMREVRRVSTGFQQEFKSALDDPVEEEARARGQRIVSSEQSPGPNDKQATGDNSQASDDEPAVEAGAAEISTAAAAGMYDASEPRPPDDSNDTPEPDPKPTEPASSAEAAGMYDPEPDNRADSGGEE